MAIKTIECVDCGASVLYGRLSCPACGALLASVAGGHRAAARIVRAEPRPVQVVDAKATVALAQVAVQAHVRARPRTSSRPRRVVDAVTAAMGPAAVERVAASAVGPAPEPSFAFLGASPVGEPPPRTPWAPLQDPEPVLTGRPYQRHISYAIESDVAPVPRPGAYLPPALALSTAGLPGVTVGGPAWPSTTSAATGGHAAGASDAPDRIHSTTGRVDAATFVEIAGWFVIVGATMSVLGFLLPWSRSVIGASGVGGYLNGWGLASPTHLIVFVGLLAVLALGVLHTPVPAWLRSGLLGLAFGALLIGLTWPYLVGPLGADVGVTVTALGGLALVVGGSVAAWATRHAEPNPPV